MVGLEDTVIVTERQLASLYLTEDPERYYSILKEMGLLPLTVKTLTTERGKALLHLATWAYLSGAFKNRKKRKFTPRISGNKEFLDYLLETYLNNLDQRFRYSKRNEKSGELILAENGGAFGRLIHAMGVPIPEYVPNLEDNSGRRLKKSAYDNTLPHYFLDIVRSSPKSDPLRKDLLYTLASILLKDRLKIYTYGNVYKKQIYLQLNRHSTEETARNYALSVLEFLNGVFRVGTNHQNLFQEENIAIRLDKHKKSYESRLYLTKFQLGHLVSRDPTILGVHVSY